MRFFLFLLSSSPLLISAHCDCEETWAQIEQERKEDARIHGCRSCQSPILSTASCPAFGYDCSESWPVITNMLTASESCSCSEAKCAGKALLAFDRKTVGKIRCNNSQWTVNSLEAEGVICAKSCNKGVCPPSTPLASPDLLPLEVTKASEQNACAIGTCQEGYILTAVDGKGAEVGGLVGVKEVSCTGDGSWKEGDNRHKFVMCKKVPQSEGCKPIPFDPPFCEEAAALICPAASYPCHCVDPTISDNKVICTAPFPNIVLYAITPGSISAKGFDDVYCDTEKDQWMLDHLNPQPIPEIHKAIGCTDSPY